MNKIKSIQESGAATDSIILAFIKIVTSCFGLFVTKLLSVKFSLLDYGTYSQIMLIVTTATSISILGMTNAVNFFYNSATDSLKREEYTCTIFSIQYLSGVLCAIVILLLKEPIIRYFDNQNLKTLLFIAALLPLFENLMPMLQVLFISCGRAKTIAIRNFIVSLLRLLVVVFACFVTNSINTVLYLLLLLDIAQVLYFYIALSRFGFRISLRKTDFKLVPSILKFCIPMAICIMTSELSRSVDRYIISYFFETETLAIYTNAAKLLPFDFITASFITVLIPIVTREIREHNYDKALHVFKEYLRIGYITSWIMVFGAIINAKEVMLVLYDAKYLPGLGVFIVYLLEDAIKFANTSLLLVAKGKTKVLMFVSLISLVANFFMSIFAYHMFGMLGPAIATFISTLIMTIVLLIIGAKEIDSSFKLLFDFKEIVIICIKLVLIGALSFGINYLVKSFTDSSFLILIASYGFFVVASLLGNQKIIRTCIKSLNSFK